MIRIALLLWAAFLLASPASADIARPVAGGFIVAATQGQVSVTGTTSETNLASLRIPAGAMGRNGHIEVKALWSYTNNTDAKTVLFRLGTASGIGGAALNVAPTLTSSATAQLMVVLRANNATNSQYAFPGSPAVPFGSTGAMAPTSVDMTQDAYINLTGQLAVSTDTLTLVHAYAVVYPSP